MATATKKTKKDTTTRPLLDEKALKKAERELRDKYKRVVPGTLCNRGEDPEHEPAYKNKRTVIITCSKRGCKNTRRVATSDLHQVTMCEECTKRARMNRKNLARRKAK